MTQVRNGYGGAVAFDYEAFPYPGQHATQRYTVKHRTVQDGVGGSFQTTFGRSGAGWTTKFLPFGEDRYPDWRGFAATVVTEPTGHAHEHRFYQGLNDGSNGAQINPADTPPPSLDLGDYEQYKGRQYKVTYFDPDGSVPGKDWQTYTTAGVDNYEPDDLRQQSFQERRDWRVYTVFPNERRVQRGPKTNRTTSAYDPAYQNGGQYGNLTDLREYVDAGDGQPLRHTRRWFYPTDRSERYMADRVGAENVYAVDPASGAESIARATLYFYDRPPTDQSTVCQQPLGTNDDLSFHGFLTGLRRRVTVNGQVQYADTRYEHDNYGNRTKETTWAGYGTDGAWASVGPRVTQTIYEADYNTFPNEVRRFRADGTYLSDQKRWDARWGKPYQVTDPNGQTASLTYDGFGRLTSAVGPVADASGHRKQVQFTYDPPAPSASGRTTRVLAQQNTASGSAVSWFNTQRFYDGRGRLLQETKDWAGGLQVVNKRYDGRGLLASASVPHVVAAGLGSFLDGDWATDSQPKMTTAHDALQRPRLTTLPDGFTTEKIYQDWNTAVVDQNRHWKRQRRDGLGRLVGVDEYLGTVAVGDTTALWGQGPYASTAYGYDANDQLTSVLDAVGNHTAITADELGRKTAMVDPDMGSWSYQFDGRGNLTRQTDARGQPVDFRYDALDRLVSIWHPVAWTEPIVAGVSRITVHDLMEMRAAVDADYAAAGRTDFGNWEDDIVLPFRPPPIRARHFNEIKERISALRVAVGLSAIPTVVGDWPLDSTKPIRAQHPNDLRNWLAQYETDVAALNPNDPDPLKQGPALRARAYWGYDAAPTAWGLANVAGRRAWSCDSSGRWLWSYDAYGRMALESRRTDGVAYDTRWAFDAADRVRTLTFPADPPPSGPVETLTYGYGAHLLLTDLTSSLGGPVLLSGATYNALGSPTGWTVGAAATAALGYWGLDAAGSPYGALRSHRLAVGSNPPLLDRVLSYDAAGNVTQLVDSVLGEALGYGYDALDRLTSAGAPISENYAFDQIGNLIIKAGVAQHYPGASEAGPRHAPIWIGSTADSLSYDGNGNLVGRGNKTYQYDPRSRLTKVSIDGQTAARHTHDAEGGRTKRLDANGTVHYVRRRYERNVGDGGAMPDVGTKYYEAQLGTRRLLIAFRKGGVLYFAGIDHIGGTVKVADGALNPVDGQAYKPWGVSRLPGTNLATDRKFTGQTWDDVAGLYWFQSRYYDPTIGRFVQPDAVVPDPANPQALNRYAYGLNNPLRYIDSTGHYSADQLNDALGQGWQDTYFGDNGVFGPRDDFVKYLESDDAKDPTVLRAVETMFSAAAAGAKASPEFARQVRESDALVAHMAASVKVEAVAGGGSGPGIDFVVNLTSGQISGFFSPQVSLGLGYGAELGVAQLGLVRNLPSNDQFAGPFWGVGGFAGYGPGVDVAATFGFPSDLSGNPVTTILTAGPALGAGAGAYADVSASLEVYRWSAQGSGWLPAITSFLRQVGVPA